MALFWRYSAVVFFAHLVYQPKRPFNHALSVVAGSHWDWKTGKTWKNGIPFSSQGILNRQKSVNFTQNTGKSDNFYTGTIRKSGKLSSQKWWKP